MSTIIPEKTQKDQQEESTCKSAKTLQETQLRYPITLGYSYNIRYNRTSSGDALH